MDLNNIKKCILEKRFDAIENLWMDAIAADKLPAKSKMAQVLELLVNAQKEDVAHTLAGMLFEELGPKRSAEEMLELARALMPVLPGTEELRKTVIEWYQQVYGQKENFKTFLAASGLNTHQSPRRAIRTLDTCLAITPGRYLVNRFDGRVVCVKQFDDVMEEFELTEGNAAIQMNPKLLADEFELADENDFRVLRRCNPDRLKELLQNDPAAILIGICSTQPNHQIDSNALKRLLVPQYLPEAEWSKWWSRARTATKKYDVLSLEGRNPVIVNYHAQGCSTEDLFAQAVKDARMPLDYLQILHDYEREIRHAKQEMDADFTEGLMNTLAEQSDTFRKRRPADALAAALAIDIAIKHGIAAPTRPHPTAAEILAADPDPAKSIMALDESSLWPMALHALDAHPQAGDHFEKLFRIAPTDYLDRIAHRLRKLQRSDAIEKAVIAAMASPTKYLQICFWLWKGPDEAVASAPSRLDLLSRLFAAMQEFSRDWDLDKEFRKNAFQQFRSAMVTQNGQLFRETLKGLDNELAATIKRRVERSDALSESTRDDLLQIIREDYYALFLKEKIEPWADENILWTTEEALQKIQAELKELVEVTLPANSRAIGEAAAKGDLRENAEWQFAVDEQRRLNGILMQMQNELTIARTIHPDDVPTDSVGIGSKVTLRGENGQIRQATFIGPWDVDIEKNRYSYKTPIGKALMGKTVGDVVDLKLDGDGSTYTVTAIENGLA